MSIEDFSAFEKRGKSRFQQRLDADPILQAKHDEIERLLRAGAREDIEAIERSTLFTADDFKVTINAQDSAHDCFHEQH